MLDVFWYLIYPLWIWKILSIHLFMNKHFIFRFFLCILYFIWDIRFCINHSTEKAKSKYVFSSAFPSRLRLKSSNAIFVINLSTNTFPSPSLFPSSYFLKTSKRISFKYLFLSKYLVSKLWYIYTFLLWLFRIKPTYCILYSLPINLFSQRIMISYM